MWELVEGGNKDREELKYLDIREVNGSMEGKLGVWSQIGHAKTKV